MPMILLAVVGSINQSNSEGFRRSLQEVSADLHWRSPQVV